jgi:hypothetical protein
LVSRIPKLGGDFPVVHVAKVCVEGDQFGWSLADWGVVIVYERSAIEPVVQESFLLFFAT